MGTSDIQRHRASVGLGGALAGILLAFLLLTRARPGVLGVEDFANTILGWLVGVLLLGVTVLTAMEGYKLWRYRRLEVAVGLPMIMAMRRLHLTAETLLIPRGASHPGRWVFVRVATWAYEVKTSLVGRRVEIVRYGKPELSIGTSDVRVVTTYTVPYRRGLVYVDHQLMFTQFCGNDIRSHPFDGDLERFHPDVLERIRRGPQPAAQDEITTLSRHMREELWQGRAWPDR